MTHTKLPSLKPIRVLVVGELILDRYLMGDVSRISPEAPIPILKVNRRQEKPGNAGFVGANLRALGAEVSLLSVVGADRNGRMLTEIFKDLGVDTRAVIVDPDRPTIVKERLLGSVQSANRATQQLLRVDDEDTSAIGAAVQNKLKDRLPAQLARVDGVLISDLDKGLLSPALLRAIIEGAAKRGIPVIVDPKRTADFSTYRGATALTPNRFETGLATGLQLSDRDEWRKAGHQLVRKLGLKACLITLDRDGMYLVERGGNESYIETTPREVYDVSGAGDVALAVFGLFAIAGLSWQSAATLANFAAGLEVSKLGTEVISRADLAWALRRQGGPERKIVSFDELQHSLEVERAGGRKVVFTNGCFDLLHAGHVESLSFARAQGDLLVVGLNSDRSVRALKGEGRPIYQAADRARILAALEAVNFVVVFDDLRAESTIRAVRPDVLIKGADWRGKTVDGAEFVESYGGRVVLAPLLEGHGTSKTIERLRAVQLDEAGSDSVPEFRAHPDGETPPRRRKSDSPKARRGGTKSRTKVGRVDVP